MQPPRISQAKAIDDHTLLIKFSNGESKVYGVQHLLERPMFSPLRNPIFSKSFKIEPGGYALVWNEEIDISEHELWKNGTFVVDDIGQMTERELDQFFETKNSSEEDPDRPSLQEISDEVKAVRKELWANQLILSFSHNGQHSATRKKAIRIQPDDTIDSAQM